MTYIEAFSTPIFLRECEEESHLNQTLASTVRTLAQENPSDDGKRSHQGGFYTPLDLLEQGLPGIAEIERIFRECSVEYIHKVLANGYGRKNKTHPEYLKLNAWAALTTEGDYQPPHVHAGANFSGVYYVKVPKRPEPEGCIDLLNPLVTQEMTFIPGASTTHCRIVPRAGNLLLFPNYCRHFVHPLKINAERIVIVFNAVIGYQYGQS